MRKHKCFIVILILVLIPSFSLADDIEKSYISDSDYNIEVSSNISTIPIINAKHAIILDRASKTVLYGKEENEMCKMASTTKIMTAIIVLENCSNLNKKVTISKKASRTGGSRLGLSTNDTITVENLLYGLMMVSGNDAAVALAEFISEDIQNFAKLMNEKAQNLNLTSTHFMSPHGLDHDEHFTTAYDLSLLTDYALQNETFSKIVKTQNYSIRINNHSKQLNNTNELLGYLDGIYGVKTGFTNGANRCLVTACKRENLDIICVVLGCDTKKDRTKDSVMLINYIFNNYTMVNVEKIIKKEFDNWKKNNTNYFKINKSTEQNLSIELDESQIPFANIALNNSDTNNINISINVNSYLKAPVLLGDKVGSINIQLPNSSSFTVDILSSSTIKKKNIYYYTTMFLKDYFSLLTF